ncbi:hypothetical protein GGI21_004314 [Coemansia aciculifera]|nr:hypothetical protein GGI21_004314 [Coemansia aciculifera]
MPSLRYQGGYGNDGQQSFDSYYSTRDHPRSVMRDSLGVEVTAERLSALIKPFICVNLSMVSSVYRLICGCLAPASGVRLYDFNRGLTGLDGFGFWAARPQPSTAIVNFVMRNGPELTAMRQRMLSRLMPPGGPKSPVVLGPLLCYYLMTMACMKVGQMTGPLLSEVFLKVTDMDMRSLRVVTENGIRRMTANELGDMVRNWARDLCQYMASGSRMQESLDVATRCYTTYSARCRSTGAVYPNLDVDGSIARDMLERNEDHSRMFLGIRATELTNVYKYLVCTMEGEVGVDVIQYLRQVSESLQNLSG